MPAPAAYSVGTREWIESQLVRIIEVSMLGDLSELAGKDGTGDAAKSNLNLARLACMDLAKIKGYIVDRKQVAKASIRLDSMNRDQLQAHLASMLDELEPGARAELKRVLDAPIDIQPIVVPPKRLSK